MNRTMKILTTSDRFEGWGAVANEAMSQGVPWWVVMPLVACLILLTIVEMV